MSESAPPGVLENHALVPQVDKQIDNILDDFRAWLQQATAQGGDTPEPPAETLDLHTLASHFVALRQEINLQTKAVRSQQDQNAQTIEQLTRALDTVQQLQKRNRDLEGKEQDDQLRPIVKSLLDAYDSLALARREVERLRQERPTNIETSAPVKLPLLARWLGMSRIVEQALTTQRNDLAEKTAADDLRTQRLLESILTGYTMSLQRLERMLPGLGLEPILTIGQTFDPEKMEVVEVTNDSSRQHMEVVDEVRRGYLWRGRVFRFAQVRVAKNA